MSQENIFSGQTTDPAAVQNQNSNVPESNPFADLLGSIKNESGEQKYRDLQTALTALKSSQEYIPQLKTEKERLEQELRKMQEENSRLRAVEETVTKLTQQPNQQTTTQTQSIDPDAIVNLVNQTLTQKEQESLKKQNLGAVVAKMQEAFGAEAEKKFYSKASELGMAVEDINTLAAKSPTAVLELFGIKTTSQVQTQRNPNPTTTTINTAAITPASESFIGRNTKPVILGATTQELSEERANSVKLVEELHKQGLSTYDLTDPKMYFKHFKV